MEHEARLQQILLEFLASDRRITIIGEPSARKELYLSSVLSYRARAANSWKQWSAGRRLDFAVVICTATGCEVCGLPDVEDGVVRVSLHYNTGEWPVRYSVMLTGTEAVVYT